MPAMIVAEVARRFYGILRRWPLSTLRAPLGRIAGYHSIVSVDVEVVGLLYERETLVLSIGNVTLPASHLYSLSVEAYVSILVLHQMISVVAVHKFLFEETSRLSFGLESRLLKI